MSNLHALPPPGIFLFPTLLSNTPLSLTMKGSALGGSDYTIIDNTTSATLFTLESKSMSMHHRKTLFDSSTGQPLLEIIKETWTLGHKYSAVGPNGNELFRTETHGGKGLVNGGDTVLSLQPQPGQQGGQGAIQLEFRNNSSMNVHADVFEMGSGQVVAKIDKENWKMRHQYQLEVAPGMDPSVIVGLAVIMADIRTSKATSAGVVGGVAGGAGGGGG